MISKNNKKRKKSPPKKIYPTIKLRPANGIYNCLNDPHQNTNDVTPTELMKDILKRHKKAWQKLADM